VSVLRILLPATALGLFVALWGMNVLAFRAGPADAWTYLAAAERLNVGHDLYRLQPGDRPVEVKPPHWTVPLLSPPLIAVLWRPLALLPPEVAIYLWWVAAMLALGSVVLGALAARRIFGSIALLVFLLPLVFQSASGNVNGLLVAGSVAAWLLVRRDRSTAAGVVVATMAAVKVVPAVLLLWLLAVGRRTGVRAALLTGTVLVAVGVLGAGLNSHLEYLDVMRYTATVGQSPFSLAGIALTLGGPEPVARLMPVAALLGGAAALVVVARRGDIGGSFTIAVFTMVWGSPVVNFDWLALLFAGLAPAFWPLVGGHSAEKGS
jgi:hypothetical protein